MRIRSLKSVYFAAAVLGLAGSGTALAQREGPYLSFDAGVSFLEDLDGVFADTPGKLKFNPGFRAGAAVGYTLTSQPTYEAAVQLESGLIYNETKKLSTDFGDSSLDGDFYQVPILADILYTFRIGPRFVPYIGVGGGLVYHRLSIDSMDGFPVGTTSDGWDPAVQAMAGLRYKLDERNEIGAGYKFLATFADSTVQAHAFSLMYVLRF